MNVLIVDDHPVILDSIAGVVISLFGWTAENADSQVSALASLRAKKFDLLISDVVLPGGCMLDAVKCSRAINPHMRVVFYSGFFTDRFIRSALSMGVSGLISKADSTCALGECLRAVSRGERYFSDSVKLRMLDSFSSSASAGPDRLMIAQLTEREIEVLKRIGFGEGNAEISKNLDISVKTVNRHKSNIMDKLEIRSSSALMKYALKEGLATVQ